MNIVVMCGAVEPDLRGQFILFKKEVLKDRWPYNRVLPYKKVQIN